MGDAGSWGRVIAGARVLLSGIITTYYIWCGSWSGVIVNVPLLLWFLLLLFFFFLFIVTIYYRYYLLCTIAIKIVTTTMIGAA